MPYKKHKGAKKGGGKSYGQPGNKGGISQRKNLAMQGQKKGRKKSTY